MKGKPIYISGELVDEGIDGTRFITDSAWVMHTVKDADSYRDRINSKVYKLV